MENRPLTDSQKRKSSIFTYEAPWQIYSLNWSVRPDKHFRLAIGSFLEEYGNKVQLLELDQDSGDFICDPRLVFDHPYPPTKLMFIPDKDCSKADLISTSGDFLRLWEVHDDRIELKSLLNGNKNSEFCAPLTSFDWSEVDNRRIACSSIDNTCTVWDIERETVDAQLIAHDKEVYDISWAGNATGIFASVSGDGSVRVFDLRDKEHSTIIYENPVPETPLLRLAWNKVDPRFMAVVGMDSNKVVILDIRVPTFPVTELVKHRGSVNAVAWAPYSSGHVASAGDDSMVLIWELPEVSRTGGVSGEVEPLLSYGAAESEVNQLQWSSLHREWIAIAFSNKMQLLRI